MTAVCGADKTGPPTTLTTPSEPLSVEQRAQTVKRKPRSGKIMLRSSSAPSDQRPIGRPASDTGHTDCCADLDLPPPTSSSKPRKASRNKKNLDEDNGPRSVEQQVVDVEVKSKFSELIDTIKGLYLLTL